MTGSGDFGVVSGLLGTAQEHSNTVGKVWIMVLFVFRIFVLMTATREVWQDEQSNFLCDTKQPGCQLGCYDKSFPVSHVRFWVMQIIFVSTPTFIYLGFVLHKIRINKKKKQTSTKIQTDNEKKQTSTKIQTDKEKKQTSAIEDQDDQTPNNDSNSEPEVQLKGAVLKMYIVNVVSKILLEIVFFVAQYYLYGFGLQSMYSCEQWPCLTKVFCYVSRPTEKTIFIIYMLLVALVSLLLNVMELAYIYWKKKRHSVQKNTDRKTSEIDLLDLRWSEIDLLDCKARNSSKKIYV